MSCSQCRRHLSRYHDGELDHAASSEIHGHLAGCPACAAQLAEYRRIDSSLDLALRVTPRPGFRDAVLTATTDRVVTSRTRAPALHFSLGQSRVLLGGLTGACVALLLLLSLTLASALSPRRPHIAAPGRGSQFAVVATRPASPSLLALHGTPGFAESPAHPTPIPPLAVTLHQQFWPGNPVPAALSSPTPVPIDRAAAVRITRDVTLTTGAVHGPLWSHDSASLLYLTNFTVDPLTGWYTGVLIRYTHAADPRSRFVRLATGVRNYAWSDDDRQIAYTTQTVPASSGDEPQQLHLVAPNGTGDRILLGVDRASIQFLNGQIVAVRHRSIVTIDPASGRAIPLPSTPAIAVTDEDTAFYALSSGGRFLAYQDHSGLRVWDRLRPIPDASAKGMAARPTLIIREPLARYREASFHFSWDGTMLFYSVFDGHYTMLYRQILVSGTRACNSTCQAVALDNRRPLHGPIDQVGPPSPDNAIANFRIGIGALARNFVIDAVSGLAHPLLPPEGVGPVGYWSPDGRHLVYTVYRGDDALFSAIARVL